MKEAEAILAEAMDLPEEDRARLALRLAESLGPAPAPGAEQAWASEIARRVERLRAGTAPTMPGREAVAKARARLAARRA